MDVFVIEALFTTVTNVNFDAERMARMIRTAAQVRGRARMLYEEAASAAGQTPETLTGKPSAMSPEGFLYLVAIMDWATRTVLS